MRPTTKENRPVRGSRWVIQWFLALGVLFFSGTFLAEFGYRLAAEQAIARAAQAGVQEASMPRASRWSVERLVRSRLKEIYPRQLGQGPTIYFEQNGSPVCRRFRPRAGDQLAVTIQVSPQTVLPSWFRPLSVWPDDLSLQVQAIRVY